MKNWLLGFNIILLIAVASLFYLHYSSKKTGDPSGKPSEKNTVFSNNSFKIAYFDMDSVENNFAMVKDVKDELNKKEAGINNEVNRMQKEYNQKVNEYQTKGSSMNQVQSEAATKDLMQMQEQMRNHKQNLDQEYQDFYMRRMGDVKTKIEDFLKNFNKDKKYSFILSSDPGLFYYKDTIYNITHELVAGLNGLYKKK